MKSKVLDMTDGSITRKLIAFALPLLIGNIFQQVYTIVDTMVAGYNLGDHAIAAIGATAALYQLIIDIANGMNNGFAILVTQAFGAHDKERMKRTIAGMMVLNLIVGIVLTTVSLLLMRKLLVLLNTPANIYEDAFAYISIICGGILMTIAYNMFAGILRSVGNSATALVFLIISSLSNIILDLFFIVVCRTGVWGVAVATIIATALSALLCGLYIYKNYKDILPDGNSFRTLDRIILGNLFASGFGMALMYSIVSLGSTLYSSATNKLGESIIAAHTGARRVISITMQPCATLAISTSTFVAQNFGAGRKDRIKKGIAAGCVLQVIWSAMACTAIYLLGGQIVRLITGSDNTEIISNAVLSMRWHHPFYPALGILCVLRSSMQSMDSRIIPAISSTIELGMKIFACLWLIPTYGFIGTCVTEPFTWVLMMVYLGIMYVIRREAMFRKISVA